MKFVLLTAINQLWRDYCSICAMDFNTYMEILPTVYRCLYQYIILYGLSWLDTQWCIWKCIYI